MHEAADAFCRQISKDSTVKPNSIGLEIGGRNVNGNCREYWSDTKWLVIDKIAGDDPAVLQHDYSERFFGPGQFDIILCTEVLEHCENWHNIINHTYMDLKIHGILVLTCAAPNRPPHSAIDGAQLRPGEYYQNIDPMMLYHVMHETGYKIGSITHNFTEKDLYVIAFRD